MHTNNNSAIDIFAPMREAVERGEWKPAPFHAAHGRIVRGVNAMEIVTVSGGSVKLVAEVARDLEANGDKPCVKFHRDANGQIDGLTLCSEIDISEVA